MSAINCPQCGRVISDKDKKCKKCRFPIRAFTDGRTGDDVIDHTMPEELMTALSSDMIVTAKTKKGKLRKIPKSIIIIIVLLMIISCAGIILLRPELFFRGNEIIDANVESITISRTMKLNGKYTNFLRSDENKPFAAVFHDKKKDNEDSTVYVYMNKGKGELKTESADEDNLKDPLSRYEFEGYCRGYEVNEDAFSEINVSLHNDQKDKSSPVYRVTIVSVKMNEKLNGIFLYRIEYRDGEYKENDLSMEICDGEGQDYEINNHLYKKYGREDIKVIPLFFIPAEKNNNYSINNINAERLDDYSLEQISNKAYYYLNINSKSNNPDNTGMIYAVNGNIQSHEADNCKFIYRYNIIPGKQEIGYAKSGFGSCNIENGNSKIYNTECLEISNDDVNANITVYGSINVIPSDIKRS